ncbi:BLUF domain-containing protein [Hymenobacter sp. 5317J-9]|uniref:BLUF domain-containing protein n=1 Tax=Hymenobacter sp. 5317J-9 TaxID=2932250 RepID=UPI001FD6913B|nr:BLUF domain-containing protein [Hymenobacter sp. 5317J-9]UOQ96945.1 BLUF domain-containing protein [Hymenobacter sp. 5317J-9]
MHQLVYTSTAGVALTEAELQQQLNSWRRKNADLAVTGVLLHSEGHILQVLEGEAAVLHDLFATIAADFRHRSVTKLADGPVQARAFSDWSMGFRNVESTRFAQFVPSTLSEHTADLVPLLEAFMAEEPLA